MDPRAEREPSRAGRPGARERSGSSGAARSKGRECVHLACVKNMAMAKRAPAVTPSPNTLARRGRAAFQAMFYDTLAGWGRAAFQAKFYDTLARWGLAAFQYLFCELTFYATAPE